VDGENDRLAMLASHTFPAENGLVDVVDFLNKSLKREGYSFGVTKAGDKMTIVIYSTGVRSSAE
jgi:hypothetical protein